MLDAGSTLIMLASNMELVRVQAMGEYSFLQGVNSGVGRAIVRKTHWILKF